MIRYYRRLPIYNNKERQTLNDFHDNIKIKLAEALVDNQRTKSQKYQKKSKNRSRSILNKERTKKTISINKIRLKTNPKVTIKNSKIPLRTHSGKNKPSNLCKNRQ